MARFYITSSSLVGNKLRVDDENFHYLRNVLRIKKGENISAFDGTGKEYICLVNEIHPRHIDLEIMDVLNVGKEPAVEISIAQSLLKAKYFEIALQKCTELGVKRFIPVITERTVVKLKGERAKNRRLRWGKIVKEAAKQCGRSFYPEVSPVTDFGNALEVARTQDMSIIPWEEETTADLRKVLERNKVRGSVLKGNGTRRIMVFIGPEGGWTPGEILSARRSGVVPVSLGCQVLRSETAAIATVAILIYELS